MMIKPDASERPSSAELAEHPIVSPVGERSKSQLFDELREEQRKNSILAKYVFCHSFHFIKLFFVILRKLLDYMVLANELERVCSGIRSVDMNKSTLNHHSSPFPRSSSISDFRQASVA